MDSRVIAKVLADSFYHKMSIKNDDDFKKPTIHKILDECMNEIGLKEGKLSIVKKPVKKIARIEEIKKMARIEPIILYDEYDMNMDIDGRQVKRKKM